MREEGRCAGTYHFGDGGTLDVIVIGTADAKDQMQYKITDMTLVSIPTLPLDGHDLSLFDKKRACISVKKWKAPKKKGGKRTTITTKAQKPLSIVSPDGQWKISGYLSVVIEKLDKHGSPETKARLFHFDPESTTGSGGDIDV